MKVLQLCYKMPYPIKDGGEYSIYYSAQSLLCQPGVSLKVLALNTPKNWVDEEEIPLEYRRATSFETVKVDTRVKLFPLLKNLLGADSYFVTRFYAQRFEERLGEILRETRFDVLILEHLYLCSYLETIRKLFTGKVVLRTQNVEHHIWKRYASTERNRLKKWYLNVMANRLNKFEVESIGKVDGIITLTNEDKKVYLQMNRELEIEDIPIGFDHERLRLLAEDNVLADPPIIYHIGSMDWLPNCEALDWFIDKVLPILIRERPEIRIHLAGKKMPSRFNQYASENLIIDGEVADAWMYASDKSILIVPLLTGSGIRVKIIEAMALGKCIISTTTGAKGIPYEHGREILIADNPTDFASKVLECYDSELLRVTLGKSAQSLAETLFDIEAVGRMKLDFFNRLREKEQHKLTVPKVI